MGPNFINRKLNETDETGCTTLHKLLSTLQTSNLTRAI